MQRPVRILAVLAATAAAAAMVAPGPAVARAGWLGPCYVDASTTSGGGWCDGNGPDWTYRGRVQCTDGGDYYGVTRWAGDRRGSTAYCGGGEVIVGGVAYYHLGRYQGSRWA